MAAPFDQTRRVPKSSGTAPAPDSEGLAVLPPEGAEDPARALKRMGCRKPDMAWTYRTADGATCYPRFTLERGRRLEENPARSRGSGRPRAKDGRSRRGPKVARSINLDKIVANPEALIIVCEGEKAADAAGKLYAHAYQRGVVATTSSGGAGAAGKTDWTPLAGRNVRIWPDADEAGLKYAGDVAKRLEEIGCNITIVDAMALAAKTPTGEETAGAEGLGRRGRRGGMEGPEGVAQGDQPLGEAIRSRPRLHQLRPVHDDKGRSDSRRKGLGRRADPHQRSVRGSRREPKSGQPRLGKDAPLSRRRRKGARPCRTQRAHAGRTSRLVQPARERRSGNSPRSQETLLSYVAGVQSKRRVTVVMRTGWHEIEGQKYFVLKDETIGPKGAELRRSGRKRGRPLRDERQPRRLEKQRWTVGRQSLLADVRGVSGVCRSSSGPRRAGWRRRQLLRRCRQPARRP